MNTTQSTKPSKRTPSQAATRYTPGNRTMLELVKLSRRDSMEQRLRIMETAFPDVVADARYLRATTATGLRQPTTSERDRLEAIRHRYGVGDEPKPPAGRVPFLQDVFREACRIFEEAGDDEVGQQALNSVKWSRAARKGRHQ